MITKEQVQAALNAHDRYRIEGTRDDENEYRWKLDGLWYVVDTHSADYEVGWLGDIVSEHDSYAEARRAWLAEILKAALE